MSLYDDASLVMIPSGYKTSKVYSAKPTDGTGDLTFTRSNDTATRVNSAGLIEKVRTNVLLQSNTFNTTWSLVGSPTITANYDTNPLTGANDAWRFVAAGTGDRLVQAISGSFHNFSLYAKGTGIIRLRDSTDNYGINVTLTSSWQRISVHISAAFTNVQFLGGSGGCDATIYAAQLETGDIATQYIETTTAAVSVGPVANLPRIDYTGGGCGKLILEPQRTNVHLLSETMYEMPRFALSGAVSPTNARSLSTVSPSGYYNATELTGGNSSTGSWGIYNLIPTSISAGNQVSVSTFAKAGTHDKIFLSQANISYTGTNGAYFDLSNGTTPTAGARMEYYGNGWWRCFMPVVTLTANSPSSYNIGHYVSSSTSSSAWSTNYNGKSVYFFGTQVEAGSYATSYIPTLSAAVTRGADFASKTGISSLIGQTEGTMFAEVNLSRVNTDPIFTISDGTDANRIQIAFLSSTQLLATIRVAGVNHNLTVNVPSVPSTGGIYKIGLGYKADDFCFSLNGTNYTSTATRPVPACSVVAVGTSATLSSFLGDLVAQALLFKTRLTNAQLAELTTL